MKLKKLTMACLIATASLSGVVYAATAIPAHGSISLTGGNSTDVNGDAITYRYEFVGSDGYTILKTINGTTGTISNDDIYGLTTSLDYTPNKLYTLRMIASDGKKETVSATKTFSITPNFILEDGHIKCGSAEVGDEGVVNGVKYKAVDNTSLRSLDDDEFSSACTTHVDSLYEVWKDNYDFNEDISHYDVSNVSNFENAFYGASNFNQPIGNWNVSSGINFSGVFKNAEHFNQPLPNWSFESVSDKDKLYEMFYDASDFDQDISHICASGVDEKPYNFDKDAKFEGDDDKQPDWGHSCP